ncbi:methyltransferase domain-containing protein [Caldimonas thermodepolymerans]|uniref:Spermidine synthase n=1 Tax=Caldimonas thermodepolymerans TaxID=215580 RepID=A0A2S5T4N6_9BURK|nr:methyltransferase domain-containing protein [Caldimonas thermodepolymerans]PPE69858.1 spermidine synthase [Caldimonas thermodepolymerans]QPC32693.1 methyltransferase domain-containing protein [Caldimonas thermodepolymerans]RDI03450.1 spermidine synthase [Caldimonas thermodepolymerans]
MKATKRKTQDMAPVTVSEAGGVRYLHLGTPWVQGAMRLRKPYEIELEYVRRMMAWMLLRPEDEVTQGHAVQLGLGAAAITKFCHRQLKMRTTAVELNPEVIAVCRGWFHLSEDDELLRVVRQDAATWVEDPRHEATADVLCVDLYDHEAASPVLDDADFYAACHRVLAPGGVMSVNLFGRDASFERSVRRMARSFGPQALWTVTPTKEGNTVVLGTKAALPVDRDTLLARADNIEARFRLPARKWVRMIKPLAA